MDFENRFINVSTDIYLNLLSDLVKVKYIGHSSSIEFV